MQSGVYAICLPSYRSSSPMVAIWLLKPTQPQNFAQIHAEEFAKVASCVETHQGKGWGGILYINPIYRIPIKISGDTKLLAVF